MSIVDEKKKAKSVRKEKDQFSQQSSAYLDGKIDITSPMTEKGGHGA